MENKHKLAYIVIIIVLIIVGIFYAVGLKYFYTPPYKVLTPDVYPAGTTVSLYKEAPYDFPKEVILENKTLKYSGTVATSGGKTQTSISYISDKIMPEIVDIYSGALPNVGWTVTEKTIYTKVSILKAKKGDQNILISVTPIKDGQVLVGFQYEK